LTLEKDEVEEEKKIIQVLIDKKASGDEKFEEKKEDKKEESKEEKKEEKNHAEKGNADSFDSHGKGWETSGEGSHDIDVGMGDLMTLDKRQRSHSRQSAKDMDRKHCPGGKCDYAEDRVQEDRQGKYVEDDAANYQQSRREIVRTLDGGRGSRDGRRGYASDFDSDRRGDEFEYRSRGR
jgi:hypothetical protein